MILTRFKSKVIAVLHFTALLALAPGFHAQAYSQSTLGSDTGHRLVSKKAEEGATDPVRVSHVDWKDGIQLTGPYRKVVLRLGGRAMVDAGVVDADETLDRAFPDLDGGNTNFRRLSIDLRGTLFDALEFYADIDFAHVRDIQDNWIRLKNIPVLDHIKIGHQREPIGLEEQTSINNITFMEKAMPVEALTTGRNIGIRFDEDLLKKRMTLSLGGFLATASYKDFGEALDRISEANGYDLSGRLTYLPWYKGNGEKLLHLGLNYSHFFGDEEDEDSVIRYRSRPESRITDVRLVDTGNVRAKSADRVGVEIATVLGSLSIQGEYILSIVDGVDTFNFWGYYVCASYFLTGENREYNTSTGVFSGVRPKRSFYPLKGDWGAWELACRHSYLDLNDGDILGGKQSSLSIGLNGYLYPKIRFMFNYIRADVENRGAPAVDEGKGDIFQARFQISF